MWEWIKKIWGWIITHKTETGLFLLLWFIAIFCLLGGQKLMEQKYILCGLCALIGGLSLALHAMEFIVEMVGKYLSDDDDKG